MKRSLIAALFAVATLAPGYAQNAPYKVTDEGVKPPVVEKEVRPKYSKGAMERRVEGSIDVDAVVLADGTVGDVTVKKSLDPELDEAAVAATKQWRFRPGTKDSKPVDVLVQIEHTFKLK